MERLTYTDKEMEEMPGMDCPVREDDGSIVQKFCGEVCGEFGKDCPYKEMGKKLKEYEDAEEQGLLLRLPESDWNDLIKELAVIVANDFLIYIDEREFIINQIFLLEHDEEFRFSATCGNFYGDEICWECNNDKECPYSEDGNGCFITFSFSDIGKTVFLTKPEAEKALEEMG